MNLNVWFLLISPSIKIAAKVTLKLIDSISHSYYYYCLRPLREGKLCKLMSR